MRTSLYLLVFLVACESSDKPGAQGAVRERTNAVKSSESRDTLVAELCDAQPRAQFEPPKLANGAAFPTTKGWHWINVWATWCKPCVEEMPRLAAWQKAWSREGVAVQLSFLSADTDPAAIEAFVADHPEARGSLQVADVEEAKVWLASLGVDRMSLPVHLFVDAQGKVQCVRSSSVEDADERLVRALLQ